MKPIKLSKNPRGIASLVEQELYTKDTYLVDCLRRSTELSELSELSEFFRINQIKDDGLAIFLKE
ncbi:MAG: hypothetical protein ACI9E1_001161 [Cryomorphaceae bacterium]|jgi:hypothetical protein